MTFLSAKDRARLLANGRLRRCAEGAEAHLDLFPLAKLFTPDAECTWLLSELDPEDPNRAFGLCDLGLGYPELGYVNLTELSTLRGRANLPVERDRYFVATKSLAAYAAEARDRRSIDA